MQILIATHNDWKVKLFAPVLKNQGFEVYSLVDIPNLSPAPQENGNTAVENAVIKARHYLSPDHPWVFADDAGLEIEALNGEPGLHARRWGGLFPDNVDDQNWLDYLLKRMEHVPTGKRTAAFASGWAVAGPNEIVYTYDFRSHFEIATQPIRPVSPGSPITAVRLGPLDDLSRRQSEIQDAWEAWGITSLIQKTIFQE